MVEVHPPLNIGLDFRTGPEDLLVGDVSLFPQWVEELSLTRDNGLQPSHFPWASPLQEMAYLAGRLD